MKSGQAPLKRKSPLKPGKPLERRTPLRAGSTRSLRRRHREAMGKAEAAAAASFRRRALARAESVRNGGMTWYVCPACGKLRAEYKMEAHHVIRRQSIRRYVRALRLPAEDAMALLVSLCWDARNALACCSICHERHTLAAKRLPRALLNRKHEQFAEEIGLGYLLDREYV